MDMRAGTDTALARVVKVFGAAHPHQAYLFANRRANRMKVSVHDGVGIWLAARRLHQNHFVWPSINAGVQVSLSRAQLDALVLRLPWQRIGEGSFIALVDQGAGRCRLFVGASAHRRRAPARAHFRPWLLSSITPLNHWQV